MSTATLTERKPFTPSAVFIPEDAGNEHGREIDPADCTLLHYDSEDNTGYAYTREAWEAGGEPIYYRRYGNWEPAEGDGPIEGGRVELLPDLCIVKIPERHYWNDPIVLAHTSRLFGVYVFDRKRHVHCCSFEATYELTFLGSQYDYADNDIDDETRDELFEAVMSGDVYSDRVTYWGVRDIDRMLANGCRVHCLPTSENGGGFKVTGIVSVDYDDALNELQEDYNTNGEL